MAKEKTVGKAHSTTAQMLKSYRLPAMRPKLAEEVAKFQKNLFGFFIFVGSRLGFES
jgi:hypothetical protein